MIAQPWKSACVAVGLFIWTTGSTLRVASAQITERSAKDEAPLVVDGIVRQVFTRGEQSRNDYLIEIEVRRSEARATAADSTRSRYPAPAELMYVHVAQSPGTGARSGSNDSKRRMPEEGRPIRAYLKPRAEGGWQDALPDWFEASGDNSGAVPRDDAAAKHDTRAVLGMTIESLRVENRTALRVTSVTRGGPAQTAGLEVGDIIAGINGREITKADELTALAALGEKFTLAIIDVNSGRVARVEVDPTLKPAEAAAAGDAPEQAPKTVSLGMSAESVTLGTRSALKVIRVDPAGIAAKAGLEPGDILVAANGVPTTSVEQLLGALRKSGSTLSLTVRDTRTGRDTEVAVNLGAAKPASPKEAEPPATARDPGKLGAVTELAFHDNDFAVKVTEVTPGSVAARAGLRPGAIILAVDGKPVLHPNDLNDQVRNSHGALKFTVVDPARGTKSIVDVNLSK